LPFVKQIAAGSLVLQVGPFNKEVEWTGEAVGPKQVYIEDKEEIQGDGGVY